MIKIVLEKAETSRPRAHVLLVTVLNEIAADPTRLAWESYLFAETQPLSVTSKRGEIQKFEGGVEDHFPERSEFTRSVAQDWANKLGATLSDFERVEFPLGRNPFLPFTNVGTINGELEKIAQSTLSGDLRKSIREALRIDPSSPRSINERRNSE